MNSSGALKPRHTVKQPITAPVIILSAWRSVTYHHHGNSEVGPQLVVAPGAGGSVAVLVDVALMHQVWTFLVRVFGVSGHPETGLEGLLELLVPLGVGNEHLFAWNTV